MQTTAKALRPFKEAALALFAAGAPPHIVAQKFEAYASSTTVYKWFNKWAELKGINRESQMSRLSSKYHKLKSQYPPELL